MTDEDAAVGRMAADARTRLTAIAARSSDLRLRILFLQARRDDDPLPTPGPDPRVPLSRLVDEARGSTDPLVLKLLLDRCDVQRDAATTDCDRVDLARRWTAVDAENQIAWITLSEAQRNAGDREAARATFIRAGQASAWREHDVPLGRLVLDAVPRDLSPNDRGGILLTVLGVTAASIVPFRTLVTTCRDTGSSPDVLDACRRIATTMARDADTVISMVVATRVAARAGIDPTVVEGFESKTDALSWAESQVSDEPTTVVDDPRHQQAVDALLTDRIRLGERRWAERLLADRRVAESEAASRYVAGLSPPQRQGRDERLLRR